LEEESSVLPHCNGGKFLFQCAAINEIKMKNGNKEQGTEERLKCMRVNGNFWQREIRKSNQKGEEI